MPGTLVTCSPLWAASQLRVLDVVDAQRAGLAVAGAAAVAAHVGGAGCRSTGGEVAGVVVAVRRVLALHRVGVGRAGRRGGLVDDRRAVADEVDRGGLAGGGVSAGQWCGGVDDGHRARHARHRDGPRGLRSGQRLRPAGALSLGDQVDRARRHRAAGRIDPRLGRRRVGAAELVGPPFDGAPSAPRRVLRRRPGGADLLGPDPAAPRPSRTALSRRRLAQHVAGAGREHGARSTGRRRSGAWRR